MFRPSRCAFAASPTASLASKPSNKSTVPISGVAPNEKLWYRYDSTLFRVTFHPDGHPDRAETRMIPATVNGFYLHPALIPSIVLILLAMFLFVFLVAFVEMLLRLNEVIYAPFYALFLVGPAAMLVEDWLNARRTRAGMAGSRQ
jgi:hypothetical protein